MMNVVSADREKAFNLYTLFRYHDKGLDNTKGRVEKFNIRSMKSVQTGVAFIWRRRLGTPAETGLLYLVQFDLHIKHAF